MFGHPDYFIWVAVADHAAFEVFLTSKLIGLPGVLRTTSHLTMKRSKPATRPSFSWLLAGQIIGLSVAFAGPGQKGMRDARGEQGPGPPPSDGVAARAPPRGRGS